MTVLPDPVLAIRVFFSTIRLLISWLYKYDEFMNWCPRFLHFLFIPPASTDGFSWTVDFLSEIQSKAVCPEGCRTANYTPEAPRKV